MKDVASYSHCKNLGYTWAYMQVIAYVTIATCCNNTMIIIIKLVISQNECGSVYSE